MAWAGGLWARIARQLGCQSYGLDLSPSRMSYAREHGIAIVEDHDIKGRQFHFINTEQVMEHVAHPRDVAERLAGPLAPGGILKVSVPAAEHAKRLRQGRLKGTREVLMPVQPLEHVNTFTKGSLEQLALLLGLALVEPKLTQKYAFLKVRGNRPSLASQNSC